jgi:hypothetical protein
MGAPFEDEVIKYIAARRPLKLVLVAVTAIGIVGSAYGTVRPILESLRPMVHRVFNVSLSRLEQQKYGCAYFAGGATSDISNSVRVAQSQGTAAVAKTLGYYQDRLMSCQFALGYTPPPSTPAAAADAKDLPRIQAALFASLSAFSGSLLSRDRLSYLVFQMGVDTAWGMTQLVPASPDDRQMLGAPLTDAEIHVGKRVRESLTEARSLCPCRLPRVEIRTESRQLLLDSMRDLDEELERTLRADV